MAEISVHQCPVCSGNKFSPFITCKDYFISGEDFEIVTCQNCGLKITQDAPHEENMGKYYLSDNYISHSNTSKGLVNQLYHILRKYMLGRKRKLVQKKSGTGRILDIGAGTGYFLQEMKQHGWEVAGTEPDKEAREFARTEFGLNIYSSEELFNFNKESFDVITLWHVLEHIHRLNDNMKACHNLLKPGGRLIIALPNHTSPDARFYKEYWAAWDVPRHLWHFAPAQVEKLGENHGFRIRKIFSMPLDSFYVSILSETYRKSGMAFFKGIFYGKISWFQSLVNKRKGSSVIYVFEKAA
jgi:2-polyprenyl-3-methyl-5-hydroxy-6-metoxy-1,4-benzoquinol methylase